MKLFAARSLQAVACVLVLHASVGIASADAVTPVAVAPISGIDVSRHSGAVDWNAVAKAGHAFAYIKATEGVDLVDSAFAINWKAAAEAGIPRGAYHFYVTEDDPEDQARFFLRTVPHAPGDLRPVVDVELIGKGTQPGLPQRLRRFLEILETELGTKPVIYTSARFWDAHVGVGFGEHPLWIAEYEVDVPRIPGGWTSWHAWQWKGDAPVEGVEHAADLSRMHADVVLDDLRLPEATAQGTQGESAQAPRRRGTP